MQKKKPEIVTVSAMNYIAVHGKVIQWQVIGRQIE